MKRSILVLAAIALAGCASSTPLPPGSATVTLFGPVSQLESWTSLVVEGVHVHAESIDRPCPMSGVREIAGAFGRLLSAPPERGKELGKTTGSVTESSCMLMRGRAYGGRGRVALILRRSDEALIVDLPRLLSHETDRVFKAGDFTAEFERPLKTVEAVLERGWVRAFRLDGGRTEFELFLVLKPVRPGGSYESLQVVTRIESAAR